MAVATRHKSSVGTTRTVVANKLGRFSLLLIGVAVAMVFLARDFFAALLIHLDRPALAQKILRLGPGGSQLLLAEALDGQSKSQAALDILNGLIAARPGDTRALILRADLNSRLGRNDAAHGDLMALHRLKPALSEVFQKKAYGAIYADSDPAEIVRLASLALSIDAHSASAYLYRSIGYCRSGKYDSAIMDATNGLGLPTSKNIRSALYAGLAEAYFACDRYDQAIAQAKLAVDAEPTLKSYTSLVLYQLESNRFAAALDTLHHCEKVLDRSHELGFYHSEIYARSGQLGASDFPMPTGFLAIKMTEIAINRADIYLRAGNLEHALMACRHAFFVTPNKLTALFARGRIYLAMGRAQEAIADLNRCIAQRPELGGPYYFRSLANSQLNRQAEARLDAFAAQAHGFTAPEGKYVHLMQDYLP